MPNCSALTSPICCLFAPQKVKCGKGDIAGAIPNLIAGCRICGSIPGMCSSMCCFIFSLSVSHCHVTWSESASGIPLWSHVVLASRFAFAICFSSHVEPCCTILTIPCSSLVNFLKEQVVAATSMSVKFRMDFLQSVHAFVRACRAALANYVFVLVAGIQAC